MTFLTGLLAAEGIPPGTPLSVLAVPIGIIAFIGSVYLLVRSNLGTRRGYLVTMTAMFGFLIIQSAFWTFGAPGTPQATGPTNLPGQPADAYQPTWTPFADDSRVAERPEYADLVAGYPNGFGEVPGEFADEAEAGAGDIQGFFADAEHGEVVGDLWEISEITYAEAPNGFPVIAVTYLEIDEATFEPPADAQEVTLFGFFDEGAPLFPGLIFILLSTVLFAIHAVLLYFDELREARDLATVEQAPAERERVPANA